MRWWPWLPQQAPSYTDKNTGCAIMTWCPKCGAAHLSTGVCEKCELMNDIIVTTYHRIFIRRVRPSDIQQ